MTFEDLPALNAVLNGTSAVLLVAGYAWIRRGKATAHRNAMVLAFAVSTLFLISYVLHKVTVPLRHFAGTGWIRPVYFAILTSHTILAGAIVPLALITLTLGFRGKLQGHKKIARWTLPIWLYVSITGVVIYFLLYRVYAESSSPT
jgi:uncharacterized membrane protein YozB (DUF420 family)